MLRLCNSCSPLRAKSVDILATCYDKLDTGPHLIIVVDVDGASDDGRGKEEADQREEDGGPSTTAAAAASAAASVILGEVSATAAAATHR